MKEGYSPTTPPTNLDGLLVSAFQVFLSITFMVRHRMASMW